MRFAALMAGSALPDIQSLCQRLRAPNPYRELALLCARLQPRIEQALQLDAAGLLELLESADAFRRPERFAGLLLASTARFGDRPAQGLLRDAAATAAQVALAPELLRELKGPAIAAALRAARIQRLQSLQSERRRS